MLGVKQLQRSMEYDKKPLSMIVVRCQLELLNQSRSTRVAQLELLNGGVGVV